MLIITHELVAQIRAHLEAGYPNEACGILIGEMSGMDGADKTVRAVIPVANVWAGDPGAAASGAHSQRDRFTIDPLDIVRADREAAKQGWDIVGYFHSHPDSPSRASETDREWAWPVVSFVIATVTAGRMTAFDSWVLRDDRGAFDAETITKI